MEYYYKVYGLIVKSDYDLIHAYPIPPVNEPDVIIHAALLDSQYTTETEYELTRNRGFLCFEQNGDYYLRFVNIGTFEMKDGSVINYQLKENYDPGIISQILLCSCFGFILYQRNTLTIHGSAVLIDDNAVMLSGECGAGKSTLAAELIEKGADFISDDIMALHFLNDHTYVSPGFPYRKLDRSTIDRYQYDSSLVSYLPDMGKEKYAVSESERFINKEKKVSSFYLLKVGDITAPVIREITGGEKLMIAIENIFRYEHIFDVKKNQPFIQNVIQFCSLVPFYEITRPKAKNTIEEIGKIIIKNTKKGASAN